MDSCDRTIRGKDGSILTVGYDSIVITEQQKTKNIPIKDITKIQRVCQKTKVPYISIKTDRIIIWGEKETCFFYADAENEQAKEIVEYVTDLIYHISTDNAANESQEHLLQGIKGTTLKADGKMVAIHGKRKTVSIPTEEIKTVNLVDDGNSIPHIAITKRALYVKGDSEYDFYFTDDIDKVQNCVEFIKHGIKEAAAGQQEL